MNRRSYCFIQTPESEGGTSVRGTVKTTFDSILICPSRPVRTAGFPTRPCIPKLSVRFGAPVSNRLGAWELFRDSSGADGLTRLQAGAPRPTTLGCTADSQHGRLAEAVGSGRSVGRFGSAVAGDSCGPATEFPPKANYDTTQPSSNLPHSSPTSSFQS